MTGSPGAVVIVGAGHGGATAAVLLRQRGHTGRIVLIDRGAGLPYERPPLSKELFSPALATPLFTKSFLDEQRVEFRSGASVEAIDRQAMKVELAGRRTIGYDTLILATGATARMLSVPGHDLRGVGALRTLDDARRVAAGMRSGARLVVVGGGWIGLEVAATARRAGHQAVVIEREDRILARVASAALSRIVADRHRRQGVEILTGAQLEGFDGAGGHVVSARLASGRTISCDSVVVGVGATPDVTLAASSGLACEEGVLVDASSRTSDPAIYAIGDVARRPSEVRLESIPSALEEARRVVAAVLGLRVPTPAVPWFWSDQFDMKLQIAGLLPSVETVVVRRDHGEASVSLLHVLGDRLVAAEAVSVRLDFVAARRMIGDASVVDPKRLSDTAVPLAATARVAGARAA